MNTEQLLNAMTPEVYQRLTYAVETGRWPEGTPLSQTQRDSCMQAVMLYQSKHNIDAEHMSVAAGGEICFKSKAELKKQFQSGQEDIVRVNPNRD
ncbi:YeaC family protein [Vibrio vulnificus]|uniref:YeaC family protein n=1 Tax=Vibrio vulnificus TaxID=672 RepID=UPI001CDB55DE|nr:YeaC family protein [Vibrio vulnificus]EHI9242336.1 YeaC family protein [Vibrio vulnificus]EJO9872432.1 YeaC family protein [Vibrio vulnificus]ELK2036478.1 YeaC family protein [Vibrio vulnificus]ELK2282258.1 YeaC family protein [Vibrio vulnificus]MCA4012561.1 YeaC family protein [Vibrio vulnificus]